MRASSTQYAKTLYELTLDKNHKEIDGVVSKFLDLLRRNGEIRKIGEVMGKFGNVYNKENGIVEAQVITREKVGSEVNNKVRTWVRTKYGAKEVVLNNIIDGSIKGGIVIRVGDEVMDGSVGRQLDELKKKLVSGISI